MYALLTFDLKDTPQPIRDKFYQALDALKWNRIPDITTAWWATFKPDLGVDAIVATTKNDVATAATQAGVLKYTAVVEVGPEKPTRFEN